VSQIMWVTVPGGVVNNNTAPLRVLVVPKIDTAAQAALSTFGLQDWPATLAGAAFTVEIDGDAPITGLTPAADASSPVWRAFFDENTIVNPVRQRSYDNLAVAETSKHAATIVGNYRTSAQAFADPGTDESAVVRDQYAQWAGEPPADPPGTIAPEDWTAPDFQRAVAVLREHPAVLKHLGLILEFAVPADRIPHTSPAAAGRIRLRVGDGLLGNMQMTSPWTTFQFDGAHFLPAPRTNSDLRGGMLDLSGATKIDPAPGPGASPTWSVVTFDVAGGVARLREAAKSEGAAAGTPSGVSLPVLHSAGLALVRHGRSDTMGARAEVDNALFAEDLMLGYRVDVREQRIAGQDGDWFPLCERTATYSVNGTPIGTPAQVEEGHVKANAAVIGEDLVLRADEVAARWNGWSLVLPRPVFDENGPRPNIATRLPLPFDFRWEFGQSERKLGTLRFGKAYFIRVRVADMAGGGLNMDDVDGDARASQLILYRRHEPLPPPEFAPPTNAFIDNGDRSVPNPDAFGPGGTSDCVVIRSDPAADLSLDATQFAAAHPDYPPNDSRIMLPPPTSMALAEQHDRLNGDDAVTFNWARRAMAAPVATEDGAYNWLPDPAAVGVKVVVNPDVPSPDPAAKADGAWEPDWPDFAVKRLVLRPRGDGEPFLDWADGDGPGGTKTELIARLAAGEQALLQISSYPDARKVDELEVKEWLEDQAEALIADGLHPMVSPPRMVRLVHAVRRPLSIPAGTLHADRELGAMWAELGADDAAHPMLNVDAKSTGQLDVTASWGEIGDSETPNPVTEAVGSFAVGTGAEQVTFRHLFTDTRHRRITYTLTAVSRFRQYFRDGADTAADPDFQTHNTLAEVRIPSSAAPVPPVVLSATPSFAWEGSADLADGPVRRLRRGGRIRVDLKRPWNVSGEEERLAAVIAPAEPMAATPLGGVTRLSRDPIWPTNDVTRLASSDMFTGMTGDIAEGALTGVAAGADPISVLAVPYAVHLDEGTDRWYADVELPGAVADSYSPFVRLVLARYQKESLPGCELSTCVTTEFVQLLADRTLSVQRVGDSLQVLLAGVAPQAPRQNTVTAMLEQCADLPGQTVSDLTAAASDVAGVWHRVEGAAVSGGLNTPLAPLVIPVVDGLVRVVVQETEDIPAAFQPEDDPPLAAELRRRIVFVDVISV
jgi:hypothetical protein